MPTPKWKLVVDVGTAPPKDENTGRTIDRRIGEVLNLLAEHTVGIQHRNPYVPSHDQAHIALSVV